MKIVRMNHLSGDGKTLAFFDIQTPDGIVLKGFRVVNGSNGMFISAPNEKGKDGKYYDTIVLPKEMKNKLQDMALDQFNKSKN